MYVTVRSARLSGRWVPAGTILPDDYRAPQHLVSSGIVVRLPDELTRIESLSGASDNDDEIDDEIGDEIGDEIDGDNDDDDDTDDDDEIVDLDEAVKQYHVGGGTYVIDGERIRGRENAIEKLAEARG